MQESIFLHITASLLMALMGYAAFSKTKKVEKTKDTRPLSVQLVVALGKVFGMLILICAAADRGSAALAV